MKLSVVVPAYNEVDSFPLFYPKLLASVKIAVADSYELIVVNDGSEDGTLEMLQALSKKAPKLKVINLSKNFGKEIASTAGIFYAQGEAIIVIDADGQHPPELIPQFIKLWEEGYQVVVGIRESNQKEGFAKRYGSKLFYKLFNAASDMTLIPGATDYRLIDQSVQTEFKQFTERFRITRGIIDWMGFKRATIPFHANERLAGTPSYKVSKLFKLALNSFVSLSVGPLYLIGYVGIFITLCSFLVGLFVIIEQIILGDPLKLHVTGTAMLSIMTLFLVGILLIAQGLVSMYLSHVHSQTQNRPLFIVDKRNSIHID